MVHELKGGKASGEMSTQPMGILHEEVNKSLFYLTTYFIHQYHLQDFYNHCSITPAIFALRGQIFRDAKLAYQSVNSQ